MKLADTAEAARLEGAEPLVAFMHLVLHGELVTP
jgi:hypothetical protein